MIKNKRFSKKKKIKFWKIFKNSCIFMPFYVPSFIGYYLRMAPYEFWKKDKDRFLEIRKTYVIFYKLFILHLNVSQTRPWERWFWILHFVRPDYIHFLQRHCRYFVHLNPKDQVILDYISWISIWDTNIHLISALPTC